MGDNQRTSQTQVSTTRDCHSDAQMASIAEQAKLRLRAQAGKPSSSSSSSSPTTAQTSFRPVAVQDLSKYSEMTLDAVDEELKKSNFLQKWVD